VQIFFPALVEELKKLLDQINISRISGICPYRISGICPYRISGSAIWYPAGCRIPVLKKGGYLAGRISGASRVFIWDAPVTVLPDIRLIQKPYTRDPAGYPIRPDTGYPVGYLAL
jgi:hypothetical protein